MNKEQYEKIRGPLEQRVNACKDHFDRITVEDNLIKITVEELIQLKNFADEEINHQTRILQIDLYHIIGMGNLSASQTSILMKLIQSYSSYRPDLHALNSWNGNIFELPKIPRRVKHKLKEFDIELISGRDGEVEEESIDDSKVEMSVGNISAEDFGSFDGKNIKLTSDQVISFSQKMFEMKSFNLQSADVMYKAIINGKLFGGIQWMKKDSYYLGCPINPSTRTNVAQIFTNK